MNHPATSILRVERLKCIRNDIVLFNELDFRLHAGEILQVTGVNGSGKTSLLRILCGLILPEEGTVFWNDIDICEENSDFLQQINYVGHLNGIKNELTPLENLGVAAVLKGSCDGLSKVEAIQRFGLSGLEDISVQKLSSGQRRRVALSRLLLSQASLWVLDEPFTSLDNDTRKLVNRMIETHCSESGMVVMTSHEPVEFGSCNLIRLNLERPVLQP